MGLVSLCGLLVGGNLSVPAAVQLPDRFDVAAVDAYLASQVGEGGRVGLSVAIVRDGRIVLAKGYGKRSLETGAPATTDTLFAIGSVTKQFTCACILLLAEDGKLSVTDKVAKYYPHLTRAEDITLLDLMNHTSGYPDYYPLDYVERPMQKPIDPDELLRRYAGGKLDFEPGTQWSYSNTGYILLGRVVEKVSGESFGAFLTRRILRPLDMEHTVYEPEPGDDRLATGYGSFALSPPKPIAPEGHGWIGAAGGIYSTPSDLARWDLALMEGRVLKPASLTLMTTPRELTGGKLADYGCGLSLRTQAGRRTFSHNGAVSGFVCYNAMVPSTRSAVIMNCNENMGFGSIPSQIFSLLLKDKDTTILPNVSGSSVQETVRQVFRGLQKGTVDRKQFSAEFNHYLTEQMVAEAAPRLARYGEPKEVQIVSTHERGGMEVTSTRLTFADGATLRVLMYRKPDGIIEQYFVDGE